MVEELARGRVDLSFTPDQGCSICRQAPLPETIGQCQPMPSLIERARTVLELEAEAIRGASKKLSHSFEDSVKLLYNCQGKVVVTGMGKSGHIARKLAATFASTGTPAFFVHIAELKHGDLGMIEEKDVVVILSGSGETPEITTALDPLKRLGAKLIALTGNIHSTLGRFSDVAIDVSVDKEACPHNLAPTTSTTVALAMGDALAIVLMVKKGFRAEDYARSHPGGNLGRQLITVKDVMRKGINVPIVQLRTAYTEVLEEITRKKLGFTTVCDQAGCLQGIITDGDLRRSVQNSGNRVFDLQAKAIMTTNPKTISQNSLAVEALKLMEHFAISDLVIIDEQRHPLGLIDLKDLLRAGVF